MAAGNSNDSWRRGDLALCVKLGAWKLFTGPGIDEPEPQPGCVYAVTGVDRLTETLCLGFDEFTSFFAASRFRKIPPLTDEERDEFLADIRQPEDA